MRSLLAFVLCGACTGAQAPVAKAAACGGAPLVVRFLEAGQGLAAIVELPGGQRVLVDAGESPDRPGCGPACSTWHDRVVAGVRASLGGRPLDLLWNTHPHSDHLGGAPALLEAFDVRAVVHNGRDAAKPLVARTREVADRRGARWVVVEPGALEVPLRPAPPVRLTSIVPARWPEGCAANPNDCSIGLRVDYCASSVLFVGDAEEGEEQALEAGPVTLLQVGHHGSDTSSSESFLRRVAPRYAVLSVGKPGEGTNRTFCHPRAAAVERLSKALGGPRTRPVRAFDGAVSCRDPAAADHWGLSMASERLRSTAEGEVVLSTSGDGEFR